MDDELVEGASPKVNFGGPLDMATVAQDQRPQLPASPRTPSKCDRLK